MYENFYGLKRNPFSLNPDPDLFFMSSSHEEALSRLLYAVKERKGFVVITGEVGAGKTTVVRRFISQLSNDTEVIMIFNTFLSPKQLIETILLDLGITYKSSESKAAMIRKIYDYLLLQQEKGRTVVLIIDEAQNLSPQVLEEIRMLSNLETGSEKLLQIVLVGQPELRDTLNRRDMFQLKQRLFFSYHIKPLSLTDSLSYMAHRIRRVYGNPYEVFTPEAMELIVKSALGIPRIINLISDNCLISGFAKGEKPVSVSTVQETLTDLGYEAKIEESLWEE